MIGFAISCFGNDSMLSTKVQKHQVHSWIVVFTDTSKQRATEELAMPTGVLMFFALHLVALRAISLLLKRDVSPDSCQGTPGTGHAGSVRA